MSTIRVLLVDDHALVRAGIRSLLEGFSDIEVVGEIGDGRTAIDAVARLHPHIVLMDVMMPGLNGLEATARIAKDYARTRTIVLTMNATEEYVLRAMRAGAAGYVLKNVSPAELEHAIRAVADGETYLSAAVSKHVIAGYVNRTGDRQDTLDRLTPRQREILQFVAEGMTNKDIARRLDLSVKTVEMHRSQLMQALDIHDIAGLVRYALRIGLVSPDH